MVLSSACAVHCLATPVLIAGMPFLGGSFIQDPKIEMLILGISFLISLSVILWGYIKYHHSIKILVSIFLGFGLMLLGHFWHGFAIENVFIFSGSLLTIFTLFINNRAIKAAKAYCHCN